MAKITSRKKRRIKKSVELITDALDAYVSDPIINPNKRKVFVREIELGDLEGRATFNFDNDWQLQSFKIPMYVNEGIVSGSKLEVLMSAS